MTGPPAGTPVPAGTRLVLDDSVRCLDGGGLLAGGFPGRLLRLTAGGATALAALLAGSPTTVAQRLLGRRLVDAGMAHPVVAAVPVAGRVTVVVPARDRAELLEECLAGVPHDLGVLVVDDGSTDPGRVAAVCRRAGATLVTRPVSGGPGAARNAALDRVTTELVAFLDSDCVPDPGWLGRLVALFDDPQLGAAAPRIRPLPPGRATPEGTTPGRRRPSVRQRFVAARSPLDMGRHPGPVGPGRQVRYVPTAALVVRRSALVGGPPFDARLRYGEDVDLVWRLVDDGWMVRYLPSATVGHHEPESWRDLLARRFRYGTSAGPLARRHPGRLAPVELRPWPTAAAVALLAGHPVASAGITAPTAVRLARTVRPLGVPASLALRWGVESTLWTVVGLGRAATVLAGPALAVSVAAAGRRRRRLARAALALALVPPAVEWWQRRPALDPLRWAAASLADDLAYGAGVWVGCWRARTLGPLLPGLAPGPGAGAEPDLGGPGPETGDTVPGPV